MRRLILATLLTISGLGVAAPPTLAAGNNIQVTTTADGEFPADGKCSLAAAILASNSGGYAGYCSSPGTPDTDTIRFNLGNGVPVITLLADLPAITAPVIIEGDTGGANRVRLDGSGTLTVGLDVQATGTTIKRMVIDGFFTGIAVSGTAGTTIIGNVIGPNSDAGILVGIGNSNLQLGGTADPTPGDTCDGDCNLISGNGRVGVEAYGGGTIEGNFFGTDKAGDTANANGVGLLIGGGDWTIGGHVIEARNLVSGNTGDGLQLTDCTCTVQGNFIGTTTDGNHVLGNGGDGIDVDRSYTTTIGGPGHGTANVISANGGSGIYVESDEGHEGAALTIYGNRIGLSQSGKAFGNGGDGVHIGDLAPQTVVGSTGPHTGNVIAHSGGAGVRVVGALQAVEEIRGNSIFNNADRGIALDSGANDSIAPPVITSVSPLAGTACASCVVDVYSDKADEGRTYQGSTMADAGGNWTYTDIVYGPFVTATNTGANNNTSEFSAAVPVSGGGGGGGGGGDYQPDGRINKFSGAYVGNDIYNADGTNQTKSGTAKVGYIVEFHLSLQNDGDAADRFVLGADAGSTPMYRVKYYRGSNDITAQVVAGTYQTPSLAPGAKLVITVDVIVKKGATAGSSVSRLVTITSVGDNSQLDALKFVAARR